MNAYTASLYSVRPCPRPLSSIAKTEVSNEKHRNVKELSNLYPQISECMCVLGASLYPCAVDRAKLNSKKEATPTQVEVESTEFAFEASKAVTIPRI